MLRLFLAKLYFSLMIKKNKPERKKKIYYLEKN